METINFLFLTESPLKNAVHQPMKSQRIKRSGVGSVISLGRNAKKASRGRSIPESSESYLYSL